MPTLAEILAQAADDAEFDIAGNKFKGAQLKAYDAEIKAAKAAAKAEQDKAERMANEAATLLAKLNEKANAVTEKKVDAGNTNYDWKTDPLFAPIVAEINSALTEAKRGFEAAEATRKQLEQVSSVYAYERMRGEYDRSGYKDKDFESLAKEAIDSKHFDRFGLPTLSPIINRLTEPSRIEAAAKEAVAKARKDWEAEQNAAAAAPSRGASRIHVAEKGKREPPPNKRIEDLTADMVVDAERNDPAFAAALRGEQVQ